MAVILDCAAVELDITVNVQDAKSQCNAFYS